METISDATNAGSGMLLPLWETAPKLKTRRNVCLITASAAFAIGICVGVLVPYLVCAERDDRLLIRETFVNHSYGIEREVEKFERVTFLEERAVVGGPVEGGIYWSDSIERSLPAGYATDEHRDWNEHVDSSVAVKLETGCGRMQNRLVTFKDGSRGCVRYRQNTDQIQGELFSFYLGQVLGLRNLAPSVISVIDTRTPIWAQLGEEISRAQWSPNRPVVLTEYIPDLDASNIPSLFRPSEKHLNKNDVLNVTAKTLVELAQWSDLIIFDYLTANLDRIVNNLYNFQWNTNIMEAPAHNLARSRDTGLLVFLDNESGLLHGYRLLDKYENYHAILLENLCLFRRRTAERIGTLKRDGNVGTLLRTMFEKENGKRVRDVLPTIPEKSVKILNERIARVHGQIVKCAAIFET